jgi:nucleoside-diphosphate-sugar epimerase
MDKTELKAAALTIGVSGASGFLGKNLVDTLLRAEGVALKVLHHSAPITVIAAQVRSFHGDLVSGDGIDVWVAGCDVVVNLAYLWNAGSSPNLTATRNLVDACVRVGVRRLVHISTAAVVGRARSDWIDEATDCHPATEYGKCKLEIESMLLDKAQFFGFDLVILRPTSVFGVGGAPLKKLCGDLRAASGLKNYLKACLFGRRAMNLVHVENVTAAIIFAIKRHSDFGGTKWLISEDDMVINNYLDIERFGRARMGVNNYLIPILPLPLFILEGLLRVLRRNIVNPRCRFKPDGFRALGFMPVRDLQSALCEYFDWYIDRFPKATLSNTK